VPDQVKILSRKRLVDGYNAYDELELQYEKFDGSLSRPIPRELMVRPHAVSVVPYDPVTDRVVLIEQFRVGAWGAGWHPWCFEIVAGRAEPGEELADVAIRETKEETGLDVLHLEPVCTYLTNPSCSTEVMHLFAAHVACPGGGGLHGLDHEDEDIRVFEVPAEEAFGWLSTGAAGNANLVIGLQSLALRREEYRRRWRAGG
jgi:ADP-ribose pyrophosphatase